MRVVNGSGGTVFVLMPKPVPTLVAPYLSSRPLLSKSSGDRLTPATVVAASRAPSGFPVAPEKC